MSNDLKVGTGNKSTIRYKTQRNQLASQKAGKEMSIARVYANNTYDLTDMANQLAVRGCLAKKADIKYVLDALSTLMQDLLIEGNTLDVGGLVTLTPVIKGTFEDGETFNDKKHAIVVSASAGSVLRTVTSASSVERIGGTLLPVIDSVENTIDYTADTLYGSGVTANMKGKHLSFDDAATDEGVFLACSDYAGGDLSVAVIKASATEIAFRVNGEIDATYTATLTFKTRGGDKNADPITVTRTVTLKPAE